MDQYSTLMENGTNIDSVAHVRPPGDQPVTEESLRDVIQKIVEAFHPGRSFFLDPTPMASQRPIAMLISSL